MCDNAGRNPATENTNMKTNTKIKTPSTTKPDPSELLATLRITKRTGRPVGGTWVSGTIGGHDFEVLVFPEHAECESYELAESRISKLYLRDRATKQHAANFDRGWDIMPTTDTAKAIVDLLAAGIAELIFGT